MILALLSGVLFLALQHIRPQRIQPLGDQPAAGNPGSPASAPSGTVQVGTASPMAQSPSSPVAPAVLSKPSTPDEAWARPVSEPAFAAFKEWTVRHQSATTVNPTLEQEGVALARERLSTMADLIQSDPERALALAVPPSLQSRLPAAVQALTESWVKQTGDYEVICVTPLPGRLPFAPFVRVATLDNTVHRVFAFGRALEYVSRSAMPMNGISVPVTAATRPLFTATGHPVTRLMAMSAPLDGSDTGFDVPQTPGNLPTAESGYTEGRKRYLLMRVDFSDYANDVFPTNTALQHMTDMSNFLAAISYNKHIIAPVGKGSDITPVMRMANLVSFYDNKGLSDLYPEARNTAQNFHDYDLSKYDFFFVCTGGAPAYGYAGLGYVGGVGYHLANGYFDVRTSAHELGHNLGLSHANWWETGDRSTLGAGSNQEYGDPYDTMGGSGGGIRHFSASFKNRLDWIPASDAITVTSSGTHRLHAHDITIAPFGLRAIRLNRSSGDPYWIEFRQLWTGNKALMNGVSFRRAAGASQLIDMNPGSSAGKDDVSLTIGRTFSDAANNLHVTALRKGNTFPESIDLQINLGTFPGNQSPVAVAAASTLTAAVAQNVTFTATTSDPNGDALAYFWDFGDGDYSVDNSATTTHSFTAAGEYYVEVTVSDMKGGVARDSVIVTVGSAGTFAISGRVLNADGQPLGGMRLSVNASRYAFSESDGTYTISRLAAGSYTVSAIDPVNDAFTFANPFFNNPVAVGPDFTTADFIVSTNPPPIVTPLIAANSAWKYLDNGTDQGTAWRAPAFLDTAWATGNGVLGYTDGDDAINTTISFGPNSANKYITYYFRRTFTVANPGALTSLLLKTLRDDAAVVYLNGTEIYRDNLPAGTPLYTTLANASSEANGYLSQSLPTNGLLAGNNTLAVEVHQSSITSSDVVFDLSLDGLTAVGAAPFQMVYLSTPAFRQVLTNPPSVTLNAFARSSAAAASRVDFYVDGAKIGEDAASPFSFVWPAPTVGAHTLHVVAVFGAASVSSASVPVTIAAPAALSVTLGAPEAGSDVTLPASLPLAASVTAGAAAISYVEFYANGLPISQDNTAPFTATLLETLPGTQEILAVVADTAGNVATSAPVHVTFSRPDTGADLISFGDVWNYLDDGSNQGNAWRARNFDDRAWLSGPGRLGYGGDGESTLVSAGTNAAQRYITTYFRKHFTVANPASYGGLLLRLRRDDGAVVYLNGTEVFRDNLPSGLVSWITLASTTVDGANETNSLDLRLSTAGLITGTNVIAVELHQASVSSSDIGLDLALIGLNLTPPSAALYLTQPAEGAHFNTPASVQLAAYAVPALDTLESIQYFADGSLVASGSLTPPYAATWANAPVGNHQLHVVAVRGGIASTSAPVNVAVGKAPPVISPLTSTVIPLGAAWRYWDNVAAVGPGWQTRPFNDSAWPSANARFGWGFDGENTTLTSGRVTHYFRRWFNLPPAGSYSELVFQIARDDGAVVYMNGIEIFRSNMPNGPVTASTLAATTVNAPEETLFYEISLPTIGSGLVTGTNLVAVELHQSAVASSDAGFDMQLIAYGSTAGRVYLTTPLLGTSFSGPQDIAIEALARGSGASTVTNVEFFIDGQKLGELAAAPWRVTWSNAPLGGHLITAHSHDALGFTSVSAPLEIAIGRSSVTSTLIASNSVWRFRDTGVDLGAAWVNLNFNEAGWGIGAARLGFGNDGEVTTINGGPTSARFPTIYFRKKFVVTPGAVFTNLLFKLACDDGAVLHLNGQEVYRHNMADGPVTFATLANSATDEQTFFPTSVPITGLPAGTNILAVEVHQSSATSSDLGLNLELTAQGYEDAAVPPKLKILIDDDVVELRWPTTAVGWQVYSASTIDAPAIGWTLTPGTLLQLSGENVFTVTPGVGNQFFRLRKQ
jgi:PKD domain/Bacterial Ig domain/Carboxypeptidase regulatory-like domain